MIYDIGTHAFVEPAQVAPGGAIGVALLINHLTELPIRYADHGDEHPAADSGLVLSKPPVCDNHSYHHSHLFSGAGYSGCSGLPPSILGTSFLCSLYGGVVIGVGMALIFLAGTTTGGLRYSGISLLQKKRPQMSIGRAPAFGGRSSISNPPFLYSEMWTAALFGLVTLFAQTKVIDSIIYGGEVSTMATVVTKKPEENRPSGDRGSGPQCYPAEGPGGIQQGGYHPSPLYGTQVPVPQAETDYLRGGPGGIYDGYGNQPRCWDLGLRS